MSSLLVDSELAMVNFSLSPGLSLRVSPRGEFARMGWPLYLTAYWGEPESVRVMAAERWPSGEVICEAASARAVAERYKEM